MLDLIQKLKDKHSWARILSDPKDEDWSSVHLEPMDPQLLSMANLNQTSDSREQVCRAPYLFSIYN